MGMHEKYLLGKTLVCWLVIESNYIFDNQRKKWSSYESNVTYDTLYSVPNLLLTPIITISFYSNGSCICNKIPEFKPEFMEAWFIAVEAMFQLRGIEASELKYLQVLPALPLETIDKLQSFFKSNRNQDYTRYVS